jgi:death-on-curing protein
VTVRHLSLPAVLFLHEQLVLEFGGSQGIRDADGLKSALARPRATFDGQPLYPTLFDKAAALLESLCMNHPFVDGNKRAAFAAAGLFLEHNGWRVTAAPDDAVTFMLAVAAGRHRREEIRVWLESRSRPAGRSGPPRRRPRK